MNTTTMITGAGALTGTGFALYDKDNKKLDTKNAKSLVGSSVAVTATAIASATINHQTMEHIYEKYSSAYVQSMSDEELEKALIDMDLLIAESDTEKDVKTI